MTSIDLPHPPQSTTPIGQNLSLDSNWREGEEGEHYSEERDPREANWACWNGEIEENPLWRVNRNIDLNFIIA
jgi:hypothetical protein